MIFLLLIGFLLLAGFSFSDPTADLGGFVSSVMDAFKAHDYRIVAAVVLMGAVFVARKYLPKWKPALASGKWAAIMSLALGGIGGICIALASGEAFSAAMLISSIVGGLTTAFTASGMYSTAKKLSEPSV